MSTGHALSNPIINRTSRGTRRPAMISSIDVLDRSNAAARRAVLFRPGNNSRRACATAGSSWRRDIGDRIVLSVIRLKLSTS